MPASYGLTLAAENLRDLLGSVITLVSMSYWYLMRPLCVCCSDQVSCVATASLLQYCEHRDKFPIPFYVYAGGSDKIVPPASAKDVSHRAGTLRGITSRSSTRPHAGAKLPRSLINTTAAVPDGLQRQQAAGQWPTRRPGPQPGRGCLAHTKNCLGNLAACGHSRPAGRDREEPAQAHPVPA
jgi:hypothetical protein